MTALYGRSLKEREPTDNSESRDGRFSLLHELVALELEILDAIMEGKLDPISEVCAIAYTNGLGVDSSPVHHSEPCTLQFGLPDIV